MSNRNCFLKCQIKGYIQNISRITFSIYDFLSLQTRIAFSISKSLNQDQPLSSIFEGSLVLLEIMLSRTQASCFAVLFCNQLFRRRLTRKINARWVLEPNFFWKIRIAHPSSAYWALLRWAIQRELGLWRISSHSLVWKISDALMMIWNLYSSDKMISHALTFLGISLRTVCPSTLLRAGSWRKR